MFNWHELFAMEIVFFIYGLSFVAMALAITIRYDHDSRLHLNSILWLLAAFGFSHGLKEWMDLWRLAHGNDAELTVITVPLMALSYVFLFEFGRRLVRVSLSPSAMARPASRLLCACIYAPLVAGVILGAALNQPHLCAFNVWSRYLFGFPGAFLAGLGFFTYSRRRIGLVLSGMDVSRIVVTFRIAGVGFFLYAIFGGLIVEKMPFFPASAINQESFLNTIGFPVQLLRAFSAVVIAVAVSYLLKVFHLEMVKRIHESESRLRSMTDHAQDGIIEIDSAARIEFWNPAAESIFGYTADQVLGRLLHEVVIPERFRETFTAKHAHFTATGQGVVLGTCTEFVGLRADGSEVPVEVTIGALPGATGRHAIGILRDISQRHHAEQRMRLGASVINYALNGIMVTDADVNIQMVNPAFTRITDFSADDVVGKTPKVLKSGRHSSKFYQDMWAAIKSHGFWQGEIWNRRRDGGIYPEWLAISAILDLHGHVTHYVGVFSDISERKELEVGLERMAFYDPLTGLPNRILFHERLSSALRNIQRYGGNPVAVLYLDLDLFKQVNDRHGHSVGDHLLEDVGGRLISVVRDADTVARLGGDEFAIVLTHIADMKDVTSVADKVIEELAKPFDLNGIHCQIGTSIGIAMAPSHGLDADTLIAIADQSMYEAKRSGRNQYRLAEIPAIC